jgi:hypothetical protein
VELRHPELLLVVLAPLLLLAVWAAARSRVGLSRRRMALSLGARLLAVTALGLYLADLRAVLPHDDRAVVFVVDASESVPAPARQHMLRWTREAWAARRPGDRAALVVFSGEARVDVPLGPAYAPTEVNLEGLARDRTDLAGALRLASGLLSGEAAERRIVLLSDGNGAREPAVTEAMALASSGVEVTTVAVEVEPSPREVLVGAVSAPPTVSVDEAFLLKVEVVARGGGGPSSTWSATENTWPRSRWTWPRGPTRWPYPSA